MWPYTDDELSFVSGVKKDEPANVAGYDRETMLYGLWASQLPNYDFDTYGHGA
tara:strand:- start:904 stop:1062 length:159 start_codon:yes stop_codon:yes gene_type:complete